jgi:hypothetical protein
MSERIYKLVPGSFCMKLTIYFIFKNTNICANYLHDRLKELGRELLHLENIVAAEALKEVPGAHHLTGLAEGSDLAQEIVRGTAHAPGIAAGTARAQGIVGAALHMTEILTGGVETGPGHRLPTGTTKRTSKFSLRVFVGLDFCFRDIIEYRCELNGSVSDSVVWSLLAAWLKFG